MNDLVSKQKHRCKDMDGSPRMAVVKNVWIKQNSTSTNEWAAESIMVQDSAGSSTYVQYSLFPTESRFWTDGYK